MKGVFYMVHAETVCWSNRPCHGRPQVVPALCYRLLNVTGTPVLWRFSPATAACGGTDRLIRESWGKKLGRQQAYLRTLQLGKYSGGE
jgi:hypothetical protein